jgi:hypothetical protein
MKKINYFLFLCVLASLLVTSQAHAAILYGHNSDLQGGTGFGLYRIDTVAQTVTLVGADACRTDSGPDIQLSPDESTIYMSRPGWIRSNRPPEAPSLFLIDPTTGLNTGTLNLSGFPGTTDTPTALEFVGSTLYASFHEAGPEDIDGILGTLDLSTGAITPIGPMTGMNRPTGGLHYVGGTMYAVSATDNNDSRLFTVDLNTGAATLVAPITLGGVQQELATALAYADGKMYTLLNYDTNLYSVDLSTGFLTLEFDLGVWMNSLTSEFRTIDLTIEAAEIEFKHGPSSDRYNVTAEATLDESSDGIDPLVEDVCVTVGTSSLRIPAGSFWESGPRYEFRGTINNVEVWMRLRQENEDHFEFNVQAYGVDLTGTCNPVDFILCIGDDVAYESIKLRGRLEF